MTTEEYIEYINDKRKMVLGWYTPQGVTLAERVAKDACDYRGAAFLYICNETVRSSEIPWTTLILKDHSKIGVTNSSEGPWGRLRVLQQGNPRELQFTHLYVGPYQQIMNLEKIVKELYCYTEWSRWNPDFLKSEIDDFINHLQYSVWPVEYRGKTTYKAKNKSSCWMNGDARQVLQMQIDRVRKSLLVEGDQND